MRGEGIPASLGGQVPEVLRRRLLTQQHPEGHSKSHGAARSPKTQSHKVGGTQGGQQHRAHPRVLGLVPGARARAALLPLPPSDFGEVAWMPSRASVSPRETWPRGNQQQLARGRDAHTSPREAPAHSSSLQNTVRRVGRKKTPKARKKKKHQQNIKTWLSIPRARGTKQCPLQEGTEQPKIPGKFRSGHLHPSGTSARARPGAAPHAAPPAMGCGFLLLGEGTERGDLSLGAGAVINNRKRTCQEGQEGERDPERKEAVRKQSLPFFAARRPAPTRHWARGGEQSRLSTALSGLGSAASFSQRAHRSSPSL